MPVSSRLEIQKHPPNPESVLWNPHHALLALNANREAKISPLNLLTVSCLGQESGLAQLTAKNILGRLPFAEGMSVPNTNVLPRRDLLRITLGRAHDARSVWTHTAQDL